MTEMTVDGIVTRYSEHSRYPLPPFPAQVDVEMDGWNRYKLPSPTTGRLTAYTRATTVSSTTPDYYQLNRWKVRTKVAKVMELVDIERGKVEHEFIDQRKAREFIDELYRMIKECPDERNLGRHIDLIEDLMGGADAKELGGAVHDWIAELDMGRVLLHQIPDQFQPYAVAYQDAMARAGLVAVPEYTERLVLNDRGSESIAGRLDGIALCVETGEHYLMDRKTSKTLDFSWLEYGVQLAVYAGATRMLKMDRSGWDPMPTINMSTAYILHVPSDQPERSEAVALPLHPGGESMATALQVRQERRSAKARFAPVARPIPSEESLRYVAARQALQNITAPDEMAYVYDEYHDVWDNDLFEFGTQCAELLTATTDKEN